VHLGSGLAAILRIRIAAVMRVATHLLAARHRVLWRSHAHAVQSIRRKNDGQCRDQTHPRKTHAGYAVPKAASDSRKNKVIKVSTNSFSCLFSSAFEVK